MSNYFKEQFKEQCMINLYGKAIGFILDHIAACSPCPYQSIQAFADNQLDNGVDIGVILERLIDSNEIEYCHLSQTYSTI
jgi:hypothetical protein